MRGVMIRTNRNKVVILDLGNVVVDWEVGRILDSLNLEIDELSLLKKELFSHQDWLDMDHGKLSETAVVSSVCERSPLTKDAIEVALLAAKNSLSPIAESISLMQEISDNGIEMFCLSNMSCETYDHIKDNELFDMFSGIVISGVEGCMKPNEDIFHLTINRFRLEPMDTLFIDDSMSNIETAQRLGINGFHFKRSQNCYSEIRELLF
jgi:putative hydrolase of the HAD superfamily